MLHFVLPLALKFDEPGGHFTQCSMACNARKPLAGLMRLWQTSFTAGPMMKKLANIVMGIVVARAVT